MFINQTNRQRCFINCKMLVLFFVLLASVNSFLLDNPKENGWTATTNQYLTLSKLNEEMKLQRQNTALLDNSLTLLTSQLQQKFDLLDKKLADIDRQNETIPDAVNFEQRFIQLEQKYLNLEHNYNTLKFENNLLQKKKDEMEHKLFSLQNETNHQGQELTVLKTKSLSVDQSIEDLKHLGNIKPLQEFQTLQQEVKYISAQTSSLNMKEQARSQDFLVLYSIVQEQGENSTRSITNISTQMKTLQTNHHKSIKDLDTTLEIFQKNQSRVISEIESKMHDASIRDNQRFIQLQRQINTSTELVSMTAHPSSSSTKSGIIKFDDVKFSVGIDNLAAFKSTGKFVVKKEGLYLISVSIRSNTNSAHYYIYLNGNEISYTYIGYISNNPSTMYHTGSVVVALQLHYNDSLWVSYPSNYYIDGGMWSTLTIIKLK